VTHIELEILQRSLGHVYCLTALKFMATLSAAGTAFVFYRQISKFSQNDLGSVQKYLMILLCLLVLYDDPFFGLRNVIPFNLYYFLQALTESSYISVQLFVWLVLVHSVGTAEQIITIDESRFYWPKGVLCTILNVCLILEKGYLSLSRAQDPSYWVDSDSFLTGTRIVGAFFLFIYLCYFFMLALALLVGNY